MSGTWTVTALPTLSGDSLAADVNDSGVVVGWSEDGSGQRRAVRWHHDGSSWQILDLGTFGGNLSEAYAINDSGDIVGKARTGATVASERAFLWDGALQNLSANTCKYFIDTDTTWVLREAHDISDDGIIVGWGLRTDSQHADLTKPFALISVVCQGDVDGSGNVDVDDLIAVLPDWDTTGCHPSDANNDNVVDVDDLIAVILNWDCGSPSPEAPPQSVTDCLNMYSGSPGRLIGCPEAIMELEEGGQ